MFTGNDLPDFGGLFRALGFLAIAGVILGGYELVRLGVWLYNHVSIN